MGCGDESQLVMVVTHTKLQLLAMEPREAPHASTQANLID